MHLVDPIQVLKGNRKILDVASLVTAYSKRVSKWSCEGALTTEESSYLSRSTMVQSKTDSNSNFSWNLLLCSL